VLVYSTVAFTDPIIMKFGFGEFFVDMIYCMKCCSFDLVIE